MPGGNCGLVVWGVILFFRGPRDQTLFTVTGWSLVALNSTPSGKGLVSSSNLHAPNKMEEDAQSDLPCGYEVPCIVSKHLH